jgi:hypothetical protein
MARIDRLGWAAGISFVSYGLRIGIRVNQREALDLLPPLLPPGWRPSPSPDVDYLFSLQLGGTSPSAHVRKYHLLYAGSARIARSLAIEDLFEPLESNLQLLVAQASRRHLFIHAGVVGWRGRAIVIPGGSFSGKTTLVAALLRAGATYYSDEYAVLDLRGRVHPYPRRLSIREEGRLWRRRCCAVELGSRSGIKPLPVGLIAITSYKAGARWRPRSLSPDLLETGLV